LILPDEPLQQWFENPEKLSRTALVFDRDNTLIRDAGQTNRLSDFEWMADMKSVARDMSRLGASLVIVSNQAGLSKGLFLLDDLISFNQYLVDRAQKDFDLKIDAVLSCPHLSSDNCLCRKPKPGMIKRFIEVSGITPLALFGDAGSDIESADNAGIEGVLIEKGQLHVRLHEWVTKNAHI
jgi:D-glycero-D-manno-heptose 1,7-bisphosphate phosphatase